MKRLPSGWYSVAGTNTKRTDKCSRHACLAHTQDGAPIMNQVRFESVYRDVQTIFFVEVILGILTRYAFTPLLLPDMTGYQGKSPFSTSNACRTSISSSSLSNNKICRFYLCSLIPLGLLILGWGEQLWRNSWWDVLAASGCSAVT